MGCLKLGLIVLGSFVLGLALAFVLLTVGPEAIANTTTKVVSGISLGTTTLQE